MNCVYNSDATVSNLWVGSVFFIAISGVSFRKKYYFDRFFNTWFTEAVFLKPVLALTKQNTEKFIFCLKQLQFLLNRIFVHNRKKLDLNKNVSSARFSQFRFDFSVLIQTNSIIADQFNS